MKDREHAIATRRQTCGDLLRCTKRGNRVQAPILVWDEGCEQLSFDAGPAAEVEKSKQICEGAQRRVAQNEQMTGM